MLHASSLVEVALTSYPQVLHIVLDLLLLPTCVRVIIPKGIFLVFVYCGPNVLNFCLYTILP